MHILLFTSLKLTEDIWEAFVEAPEGEIDRLDGVLGLGLGIGVSVEKFDQISRHFSFVLTPSVLQWIVFESNEWLDKVRGRNQALQNAIHKASEIASILKAQERLILWVVLKPYNCRAIYIINLVHGNRCTQTLLLLLAGFYCMSLVGGIRWRSNFNIFQQVQLILYLLVPEYLSTVRRVFVLLVSRRWIWIEATITLGATSICILGTIRVVLTIIVLSQKWLLWGFNQGTLLVCMLIYPW